MIQVIERIRWICFGNLDLFPGTTSSVMELLFLAFPFSTEYLLHRCIFCFLSCQDMVFDLVGDSWLTLMVSGCSFYGEAVIDLIPDKFIE